MTVNYIVGTRKVQLTTNLDRGARVLAELILCGHKIQTVTVN